MTDRICSQQGLCDALNDARARNGIVWRVDGSGVTRSARSAALIDRELQVLGGDGSLRLEVQVATLMYWVTRPGGWEAVRPTVARFPVYLHEEDYLTEQRELIAERSGVTLTDEEIERAGRPFYEVTLDVELTLGTGDVKVMGVKL